MIEFEHEDKFYEVTFDDKTKRVRDPFGTGDNGYSETDIDYTITDVYVDGTKVEVRNLELLEMNAINDEVTDYLNVEYKEN